MTPAPYPLLAAPLRLRGHTVGNRIVFCAHLTNLAADRLPTAAHAAYYGARAAGGAGLIVTEEHTVHPSDRPYEKVIAGHDPAVLDGYRLITGRVRAAGSVILAQLNHNGAQGASTYTGGPLWAPSPIPDPMFRAVPAALDKDRIAELVAGYADVAARCAAGGFQGVEIQASQASIQRAFLARHTNHRTDAYGGDLAGRSRLLRETVTAVREALGDEAIIGVRLGADEGVPGGITVAETAATARLLAATGAVDYFSTTTGLATATLDRIEAPMSTAPGHGLHVAAAVRAATGLPTIGVGRIDEPAAGEAALEAGVCDLVGVVRGQIADPAFAARALAGRPVLRCSACNQECIGRVGFNRAIGCTHNPSAGREHLPRPATRRRREAIIVGAGPAGLQAAAVAAERGHRVTVYERASFVGGQLLAAARAPHRAAMGRLADDLARRARAAGAHIRTGTPADPDLIAAALGSGAAVALAVGSAAQRPAWAPAGASWFRGAEEATADPALGAAGPLHVLVVEGTGFHPGTGAVEALAGAGHTVTVCTDALVVGQDLGVTLDRPGWRARTAALGVRERTAVLVTGVRPEGRRVTAELYDHLTGASETLTVDRIVHAGPRRPRTRLWSAATAGAETGDGHPVRIGDARAARRADAAIREGEQWALSL